MAGKEQKSKIKTVDAIIQSIFIIALIVIVVFMIIEINNLQGTARVINYSGLVRGATQREVKLEITGNGDDELITYLDKILGDLRYEDSDYDLVSLHDVDYNRKLDIQIDYWKNLKEEIYKVRQYGYENTDIVAMSEEYFTLADETVSAAEKYSEGIAHKIRQLEIASVVDMAILVLMIIIQSVRTIGISARNNVLEQKAYLDIHTGLSNKSKCEELLNDKRFINNPQACIMFDINNLKIANDTFGHSVGDQMINNFARLLRNTVPDKDFVGRYGGDEFVAVIYDTDKERIGEILAGLKREVDQFNTNAPSVMISYAYGWAISTDYTECTLRTLFDKADKYMYDNKQRSKMGKTV